MIAGTRMAIPPVLYHWLPATVNCHRGHQMQIITRAEAKILGLKRFYTGKLCKYGHDAERSVADFRCMACARERAKTRHADASNKEKRAIYDRQRKLLNPEKFADKQRKYREDNPEKIAGYNKKWRTNNPEKCSNNLKRWHERNPHKNIEYGIFRERAVKQQMPWWADLDKIKAVYVEAAYRRSQGEDVVVDHVIPLRGKKVSGLHVHYNLKIINRIDNLSKGNKFDV